MPHCGNLSLKQAQKWTTLYRAQWSESNWAPCSWRTQNHKLNMWRLWRKLKPSPPVNHVELHRCPCGRCGWTWLVQNPDWPVLFPKNANVTNFQINDPIIYIYVLEELTVSYRWTGWVGEITGWTWRLQENYQSFERNLWNIPHMNKSNPEGVKMSPAGFRMTRFLTQLCPKTFQAMI